MLTLQIFTIFCGKEKDTFKGQSIFAKSVIFSKSVIFLREINHEIVTPAV